ncbi:hypothetical protein HYALB_00010188 [Hymenoscyphus albidus]|uniref:Cyanovirin-N domain-containing protein n=1 Tax=Hymenoscyphus albidus TaxID=595503 RepID=A0A9N9PQC8_9HELO|nr:hypothetical protein HYALB_00010188 [Hymenoscyphus albidus]
MRFTTTSILTLTLSTGTLAKWYGYCLDKNNNGALTIFNDAAGKEACEMHVNTGFGPKVCTDCVWRPRDGDGQCHSKDGLIESSAFDMFCRTAGAAGSMTSD